MAKANTIFTGTSTQGVREEYARREDGQWFTRHYAFNGYGMGMTKWTRVEDSLDHLIEGEVLNYGFIPMRKGIHDRVRLPA